MNPKVEKVLKNIDKRLDKLKNDIVAVKKEIVQNEIQLAEFTKRMGTNG